ncbi:hypothetical protein [Actinoallomurus sp. CA-150999]|uniref:hypothetical protein n=1 Tax=Actinoallomurus sp. CA-150999 TaxID=3239887 RepID=UPI003D8B1002
MGTPDRHPRPRQALGGDGKARLIQYLDTRIVAAAVPNEDIDGIRRATIDGRFTGRAIS